MANFVVDSSVWIASLKQNDQWHLQALRFLQQFQRGDHLVYLPRLVFVEVCARLGLMMGLAVAVATRDRFRQWRNFGWVVLYDLDEARADRALDAALRYGLRGADAVVAALGDELQFPILAFDRRILQRYPNARQP